MKQTKTNIRELAAVSIGSIMSDVNRNVLHSILEGGYSNNETLSGETKAIDRENFDKMKLAYSTCMDQVFFPFDYSVPRNRGVIRLTS